MSSENLSSEQIDRLIADMASQLGACVGLDPVIVGIHTGGVWVARRLRDLLLPGAEVAELDVSFHRDDFENLGVHPGVQRSTLAGDLNGRHVLLVDDVLYTGRTIRAALDELFDYGRPMAITLAVLIDRGGRQLPIQPDVVGRRMKLPKGQQAKLEGPVPLTLSVRKKSRDRDG